jgi:hypothetical protein
MTAVRRRKWWFLSLAALGAAGMFLGPDGWLGIDVGPVGSAVLYAALWLFVVHLSRHSEAVFSADAPLAERQAWVATGFVGLIALHYLDFLLALPSLGAEVEQISNSASRPFGLNLGILIVGWIVVTGVVRSQNPDPVELDERDLRIRHAADRAANGLMATLMLAAVVALATAPQIFAGWMRPLIVANLLIGLLIAKTLTENVYTVVRYWREHA